ncbi:PiggyBac transposable element-derived protein 1 [Trichinella patagoniensis]|nr:PiggyBac transposable element-derived protein 1 [Trichinella patagoniensis]
MANGYPYALKIYAGRDERKKNEPLGMKVIEEMISVLERPEKHELYFNNFFASYDLLEKLSGKMIRATGTMRNSRTRKIPIMPVDEMECCRSLATAQGIAPREFHCPVTSGFQKRYHNTSSTSKTSANHSGLAKSTSTRNLENK